MTRSVALQGRTRVAALLGQLEHAALRKRKGRGLDRRNRRTWRQMILGVVVARSTRLVALGRVVAPQRQVQSVKAAAMALGYFLRTAQAPLPTLSQDLLEEAVRQLDPGRLVMYQGKALVVIDPTEYPKRSRGSGKRGRQMQHIGRVRKTSGTGTTYGYVDVWAGLVLKGKQFLPLARQLFSSRHPQCRSQNAVEEAVLGTALAAMQRLELPTIVVGDRGLGRKELIIRLAQAHQDLVLRLDPDITVYTAQEPVGLKLAALLAAQPWRGEVEWDRGHEGVVRCRLRAVQATIRFSRSGRKDDVQEASVTFVQAVPAVDHVAPLVLATTLPVQTTAQVRAVVRLYAQRWAIETGFETMHAWGQDAFMVRAWTAIDRLLWVMALAYALLVLLLSQRTFHAVREQASALLRRYSVLGHHLTVGKLAEALGLDYQQHPRAWRSAWHL